MTGRLSVGAQRKQTNILGGDKHARGAIASIACAHLGVLQFSGDITAIRPNPHIIFIRKRTLCENDNAFAPKVSMATLICILKIDAVGRGGRTGRGSGLRLFFSCEGAEFVPGRTSEGYVGHL